MWKLHFACLKKSGWDIKKSHLAFPDVIHSSMNGPLKSGFRFESMLLWCCKPHSSSPPHQLHTQLRSVRSKTWCPILETAVSELKCASDWDTPTLLSSFYATNFLIETCRHAGMLMCFNRAYLVLGTASAIWKGSVSANVVILDLLCINIYNETAILGIYKLSSKILKHAIKERFWCYTSTCYSKIHLPCLVTLTA